jgi:secreted Zn-dependent insulinase-like peptidase
MEKFIKHFGEQLKEMSMQDFENLKKGSVEKFKIIHFRSPV